MTDYGIVVNHLGLSGTWATGDTNGSGTVDLTDYGYVVNGLGTDFTSWPGAGGRMMMRGGYGGGDLVDWDALRAKLDPLNPDWDFIDSLGLEAGAVDRLMTLLA